MEISKERSEKRMNKRAEEKEGREEGGRRESRQRSRERAAISLCSILPSWTIVFHVPCVCVMTMYDITML